MNSSRQFLLGLLAVGLQAGLVAAQTQLPASNLPAPSQPVATGTAAAPTKAPTSVAPVLTGTAAPPKAPAPTQPATTGDAAPPKALAPVPLSSGSCNGCCSNRCCANGNNFFNCNNNCANNCTSCCPNNCNTCCPNSSANCGPNGCTNCGLGGSNCFNNCCNTCAAGRTGLIGGAGFYLIQPYFDNNMAFGLQGTVAHNGAAPSRIDTRVDLSHHMGVAPLVWLGYIGENGLGVRARWWTFNQGSNQAESVPMGNGVSVQAVSAAPLGLGLISGQGIAVTSELQLQVADLEALNDIRFGNWDLLFAGGLRIARLNQAYNAFIPQGGANQLLSSNTFEGAGPTLALEVRRRLGTTGLSLYGSGRGSVVFGSANQFATQPDQGNAAADHRDPALPIAEMEVGMEYGQGVGQSWFFGQIALVGQQWFGAGNASQSSVNVVPGGSFNVGSYVGTSNLNFLGLAIRMGVNY